MSVSAESELAIETRGLAKAYGPVRALKGIDLRVRAGEIYGFLGRNGAGKTTTIRILLGLVRADEGEARLFGRELREDRRGLLSKVGFFVETASAYPNLTVRENLEIQRRLQGAARDAVGESIKLLGLGAYAERRAGRLSLGNKQRLSIARALLHRPRLLILDEPVNGLDPAGVVEIRELLRRLSREEGVTVFMSSHNLAEVDLLADRIGIVHEGLLVEELEAEAFRRGGKRVVELEVRQEAEAARLLEARVGAEALASLGGGRFRIRDGEAGAPELARLLVGAGLDLERLTVEAESLEEHFLRLTEALR